MARLTWEAPASEALKKVPLVVRPLARRKIEERVRARGRRVVTLADYAEAEARFRAVSGGRSQEELAQALPTENRPGASMVVLESCRSELAGCPNAIIDVEPWRRALEEWLAADEVSERLRGRLAGDQVLFHHKLKISLSGCPNGCSRPQIADLAVVGRARPAFEAGACTACGQCAEACPDGAVSMGVAAQWAREACQGCHACSRVCPAEAVRLGPPTGGLLMGGRLGRHPNLARPAGEAASPGEAVDAFRRVVDDYIREAPPNLRFSLWRQRAQGRS